MAAMVLRTIVLLGLCLNAMAREILSYGDGFSSRKEQGEPGSSVTGHWSWMDENGRNRTIQYVADSNGFRAFGDLVADIWSLGHKIPEVGSSVVPAMTPDGLRNKEAKAKSIEGSPSSAPSENSKGSRRKGGESKNAEENEEEEEENSEPPSTSTTPKPPSTSTTPSSVNASSPPAGTSFVLLSKRIPTFSSSTAGEVGQIKPVPVKGGEPPQKVVIGILTDPRAERVLTNHMDPQQVTDRRPPKPSRVEGTLNLDNFLRPAKTPQSEIEYDYYYYDDYYYDSLDNFSNTNINNNVNSNIQNNADTSQKSARKTRSGESIESLEESSYKVI